MMKWIYNARGMGTLIYVLLSSCVFCQIPPGYYNAADGLSGDALKTALHGIIDGHTEISYTAVKEALKITDQDTLNANNVICFYTGWSYAKSNFGNGASQWNREHTWSKSHGGFGDSPPEGTDLHHLKPTDVSVNSKKGNRDFDNGGTHYYDDGVPTYCYYTTYTWEPRDEVKGDVARMIFYMETRYEGGSGEEDLEMVDDVNSAPNGEPYYGKESTLLDWHEEDPVDDWERNRNNIIHTDYQGNRNPFIDHPEYVDLIWGDGVIAEPSNHVNLFVAGSPTSTSIPLTWNDNDGAVAANGYLIKVNTTNVFSPPVDGTPEADETDLSDDLGQVNVAHGLEAYTWQNLDENTTYYFAIYPYSNSGGLIDYKTGGIIPVTFETTTVSSGETTVLIITEVADPVDHTGRFVEIQNIGSIIIDLGSENWYLCRQANGSSWEDIPLSGILNAGEVFVAGNVTDFSAAYGFTPDLTNGSISGNGNDGYFLYWGGDHSSGTLVDAYGVVDEDGSGKAWYYENSKAVRKRNITASNDNWNSSEWVIISADVQDMTPSAHKEDVMWQGTSSTNFNEVGTNWSGTQGFIPDASYNVTLTNVANKPIITRNTTINKLTIQAGSSLDLNPATSLITID